MKVANASRTSQPPSSTMGKSFAAPLRPSMTSVKKELEANSAAVSTQIRRAPPPKAAFEIEPRAVHFAGFQVADLGGAPLEQEVRIINVTGAPKRISIGQTTTPFFLVRYLKKNSVMPGMAETLLIEFKPAELRYYYDTVRVHWEGGEAVIPIYAYPVVNEVHFPPKIDFGVIPLTQTVTRTVTVKCSVPLAFDYTLTEVKKHPDFRILTPLKGQIPANGDLDVVFEFTPAGLSFCEADVSFTIAQHNFAPISCTICGSGCVGPPRPSIPHETTMRRGGSAAELQTLRAMKTRNGGGSDPASMSNLESAEAEEEYNEEDVALAQTLSQIPPRYGDISHPEAMRMSLRQNAVQHLIGINVDPSLKKTSKQQTAKGSSPNPSASYSPSKSRTSPSKRATASILDSMSSPQGQARLASERQHLESQLEHASREYKQLQEKKELKVFVCSGDELPSQQEKASIRISRDLDALTVSDLDRVFLQREDVRKARKTRPSFDIAEFSDTMAMRKKFVAHFIQIARTLLLRQRVRDRLQRMKQSIMQERKEIFAANNTKPADASSSSPSSSSAAASAASGAPVLIGTLSLAARAAAADLNPHVHVDKLSRHLKLVTLHSVPQGQLPASAPSSAAAAAAPPCVSSFFSGSAAASAAVAPPPLAPGSDDPSLLQHEPPLEINNDMVALNLKAPIKYKTAGYKPYVLPAAPFFTAEDSAPKLRTITTAAIREVVEPAPSIPLSSIQASLVAHRAQEARSADMDLHAFGRTLPMSEAEPMHLTAAMSIASDPVQNRVQEEAKVDFVQKRRAAASSSTTFSRKTRVAGDEMPSLHVLLEAVEPEIRVDSLQDLLLAAIPKSHASAADGKQNREAFTDEDELLLQQHLAANKPSNRPEIVEQSFFLGEAASGVAGITEHESKALAEDVEAARAKKERFEKSKARTAAIESLCRF